MMKKPFGIYIFLLLVLLIACKSEPEEKNELVLKLQKLDTVVLEQGNLLFGKFFEQIKVTADGQNWLFADRMRNQVFVFKSDGSFHNVIGKRGKGPKGIIQISGFDVNKDEEVFVLDAAQRLLKVFDLRGRLLHSTDYFEKTPFVPTSFNLVWYDDKILSSIFERQYLEEPDKSKLIAIMNMNGKVDTLFGKHDPFTKKDNQSNFRTEIALWDEKDLLYTNLKSSPYYQVYNLNTGSQVAYAGIKSNKFKLPEQEVDMQLPISEKERRLAGSATIRRMYLSDNYVIQHMQILTDEWFELGEVSAKENYLVIYDKATNEFIQEMKVDHVPIGVHNNQLYMVEDLDPDNYTIGIYELVEEKSSIKEN